MKITNIKIEEYKKSFIAKTNLGQKKFETRKGWYIKVFSNNLYGLGEAAPIPSISLESNEDVGYALNGFKIALDGIDYDVALEELLLLAETHGFNVPSARFAIESAAYDLFSKAENKSIAQYLNPNYLDMININSIYSKRSTIDINNSKVLKIKISERNIFTIREMIDDILRLYPEGIKLRIDFNENLDLPRAVRACKELKQYNIDYIEQPLSREKFSDLYDLRMSTDLPIGVDESLTDFDSVNKIIDEGAADVLVVKPSTMGGFQDLKKIVNFSENEGLRLVVTSAFETSVAQFYILHLIAALNISEHCGIFNIKLFKDDYLPNINRDQCEIPDLGLGVLI